MRVPTNLVLAIAPIHPPPLFVSCDGCSTEQQAQQSQALRMFSALLGQQGDKLQGGGAGEAAAADHPQAAAVDTHSLEVRTRSRPRLSATNGTIL